MSIVGQNGALSSANILPAWLNEELFEDFLVKNVPGFKKICNIKASRCVAAGENYNTIVVRVQIEVQVADGDTKNVSYVLKLPQENEFYKQMLALHNVFDLERGVYLQIIPELEEMYRQAGVNVKFGAQCYTLKTSENHVLVDDLSQRGFKNVNRMEGLDLDHTKCALKKLAEWHAASATRVAVKGKYDDFYALGMLKESQKMIFVGFIQSMYTTFLECLQTFEGHQVYQESVVNIQPVLVDKLFELAKAESNGFNVLNHGDYWVNNIMFQYDAFGKIKETFIIDYQMPRYGSPAQDLYYLIISSTKYDIKLNQFDYLIKFYHDNLVKNLNLLRYPKTIPSLKEIHISLIKAGILAFFTLTTTLGGALCDPSENANIESIIADDKKNDFKTLLFSNERYKKHAEAILPWLYNRGALEL